MYTFDSRIRYSEVDSEGKLSFLSLLNYFQDCSTFQSEDLGVGVKYAQEQNLVWVLASWQIVVEEYPKLADEVTVGTFPYEFKAFLGSRNFAMLNKEGKYLAKASSIWSLLGTETGKPMLPTEKMLQSYVLEEKLAMDYAPRKIVIPDGGSRRDSIVVKKHHLDTNHHVNNGQYVNMAMDYLPNGFVIRQMRAEYKKQAFLEDILYPYVVEMENGYVIALNGLDEKPYFVAEFLGKEAVKDR